jgi:hypothetical protein
MRKPSPGPEPDPMSGVVDRLLAQLPGLQGDPPASRGIPRQSIASGGTAIHYVQSVPHDDLLGPWARLCLGLALGTMIAWWPYPRNCGFPLFWYLSAILIIMLAGGWAGVSAWRYRASLAHVIALILMLYGIMLGAAELLPRTGYAVDRASWGCEESPSVETWRATSPTQSVRSNS